MKRLLPHEADEHILATRKYRRLYTFLLMGWIENRFPEDLVTLLRTWLVQLQPLHQGYRIPLCENIPYSLCHVSCQLVSPSGIRGCLQAIRINLYTTRISDLIALFTLYQDIPHYHTSFLVGPNTLPHFCIIKEICGGITYGHVEYAITVYYDNHNEEFNQYNLTGKEQWTLHDFLLFIGDSPVDGNEVLIEKPLVFYRQSTCDTCNRPACVTQRINEDGETGSQRQCPYAAEGSSKCRRIGCCHGCDCILNGTTNHYQCRCDCHALRNIMDQ
jgi:hypothetical protein